MPEDVGGSPFPDGWEPDDDRDHGGADEEFASVVFDEDFVRAAEIHEPTAVERLLAAAQARAEASEAEARRSRSRRRGPHGPGSPDGPDDDYDDYLYEGYGSGEFGRDGDLDDYDDLGDQEFLEDRRGRYGRRGAKVRWHRPVAWMLALLLGIGMVAFAFAAVYRGASSGRQDRIPPPATTEIEQNAGPSDSGGPSASAEFGQSPVPAEPRTP
ncbi:SCO2584 family spore wall biosynthesis protein [Streptomyces flavofungini]|uniref:Uncharacterized protein n=1 Tax=Streptomyces flavofungini TaxID=68200 RepID=A0ABS0XBJ0_9ACTN|nr:hypothetical protein [Streptomyces flavofungini]MBJ3810381.1 hypothetical protein [Streptomyces flavofungini]GHC42370.1 hypothetical protein GCM10010349_03140 [Streptomyces flavofungini]